MLSDGQRMKPGSLVEFQYPHYIDEVDGVISIPKHLRSRRYTTGMFIADLKNGTSEVFYKGKVVRIMTNSIDRVLS